MMAISSRISSRCYLFLVSCFILPRLIWLAVNTVSDGQQLSSRQQTKLVHYHGLTGIYCRSEDRDKWPRTTRLTQAHAVPSSKTQRSGLLSES
jgi:hypothetical protein